MQAFWKWSSAGRKLLGLYEGHTIVSCKEIDDFIESEYLSQSIDDASTVCTAQIVLWSTFPSFSMWVAEKLETEAASQPCKNAID